ncbi:MAG: hypothetical protein K0S44_1727 [Bacteroidetes bacterium]|nr:hypothetical protein [Bacteroidota bacterium]
MNFDEQFKSLYDKLKESSGGKYMSITVKEVMLSPEAVIEKYREMSTIEGVMSI